MRFMNDRTGELLGDLADISPAGFRLEGSKPIPVNAEFPFRVDLPPEISAGSSIVFTARSRWSQPHPVDPRLYEAGFEIMHMDYGASRAFGQIFDQCRLVNPGRKSGTDYMWQD